MEWYNLKKRRMRVFLSFLLYQKVEKQILLLAVMSGKNVINFRVEIFTHLL